MTSLALACALLAAGPARAARPELERELSGIVDSFYNLDLDEARAAADALAARRPGHPAGPFYRAVAEYQRWVAEGMRSTATFAAVESGLDSAEALAVGLARRDPAEGEYYQGAALGFRARAYAGRKQFFRALGPAVSAVKHLKKALALDPTLGDARLGLGMYHYYAARIPAGARPFAYLLVGERGDRQRGLAELREVAASDGVARMEARSALAAILSKDDEADWAGAERLLDELARRYPRNPIYRLRRAYVAERAGDFAAAAALADPDGEWLGRVHPALRPAARAWALYRAAEADLRRGRTAEAERRLAAIDEKTCPPGLKDWALLRRANALDARGKRDEADALYARVSERRPAALAARFKSARFPDGPKDFAPFFTGY